MFQVFKGKEVGDRVVMSKLLAEAQYVSRDIKLRIRYGY